MIWEIKAFVEILKNMVYPLIFGFVFFMNAWQSSEIVMIQREIAKTQQEKEDLEKKNEDLKIAILTESSVEKIYQIYSRTIQESIRSHKSRINTVQLVEPVQSDEGSNIEN